MGRRCEGRKKKDKKNPKKWSAEEDELLRRAVGELGERQWKDIAERIPGRNHVQCLQRWKKVLKPGLKKGHWTEEEDNLLRFFKPKCANWAEVAANIEGRTAKQCRERWCNHVDPSIRKRWDWEGRVTIATGPRRKTISFSRCSSSGAIAGPPSPTCVVCSLSSL